MKYEELKTALRLITKVSSDSRLGVGQKDQLQKAKRELEAVGRSGKLDGRRLFRAIQIVATVLVELVDDDAN